jgi:hypothetical protein
MVNVYGNVTSAFDRSFAHSVMRDYPHSLSWSVTSEISHGSKDK